MNPNRCSLAGAILTLTAVSASAQWLNVPAKGISRTKDSKPTFPRPHRGNQMAKPDVSGIWELPPDSVKYLRDLAADFKPGEVPILGWAETLTKAQLAGAHASDLPAANCLPPRIDPGIDLSPQ